MIYIFASIFLLIFISFFIALLVTYFKDQTSLTEDDKLKRIKSIKIFTGITIPSFIISVSLYIYGYSRKRTLKLQENKLIETPRTPENPIITIERDTPEQFISRPGDSEVRKALLESSARRLKNIGRRPGDIRPSGLLGNISDEDYWSKKRPSELQERVSYDEYY